MSLKAKIEAIIYAAEEPITVEQISVLVKDLVLAEEAQIAVEKAASEEEARLESLETASAEVTGEAAEAAPEVAEEPNAGDAESTSDAQAGIASDQPADEPSPIEEATEQAADEATEPAAVEASEEAPVAEASVEASETTAPKKVAKKEISEDARIRARVRQIVQSLMQEYESEDRGMDIRAVAGGFRMSTKAEHHDVVRAFAKSLKPPVRLSLAALETLAVIAYKQPVTVPEISEIRGVEAGGVIGTLLDRKLITTAGRKQVVGRPILYKTSKEFLLRFGLNDIGELPSMEEFEKLATEQVELFAAEVQPEAQPSAEPEAAPVEADEEQSASDPSDKDSEEVVSAPEEPKSNASEKTEAASSSNE